MRAFVAVVFASVGLVLTGAGAQAAGSGTFTIVPTVVVSSSCSFVTIPAMALGAYDPIVTNASAPLESSIDITYLCPDTLAVTFTASTGGNSTHATGSCLTATCTRAMVSGSHYLSYDLYVGSCWATCTLLTAAAGTSATGTGVNQTVTIYGYIPPAEVAAAGSYTDSVTITATF
jgi:spore coat protein U-like protein